MSHSFSHFVLSSAGAHWLGAMDTSGNNEFRWLKTDTTFTVARYTAWRSGQPSGDEGCLQQSVDAKWDDVDCLLKLPYVCKIGKVGRFSPYACKIGKLGCSPLFKLLYVCKIGKAGCFLLKIYPMSAK